MASGSTQFLAQSDIVTRVQNLLTLMLLEDTRRNSPIFLISSQALVMLSTPCIRHDKRITICLCFVDTLLFIVYDYLMLSKAKESTFFHDENFISYMEFIPASTTCMDHCEHFLPPIGICMAQPIVYHFLKKIINSLVK